MHYIIVNSFREICSLEKLCICKQKHNLYTHYWLVCHCTSINNNNSCYLYITYSVSSKRFTMITIYRYISIWVLIKSLSIGIGCLKSPFLKAGTEAA